MREEEWQIFFDFWGERTLTPHGGTYHIPTFSYILYGHSKNKDKNKKVAQAQSLLQFTTVDNEK